MLAESIIIKTKFIICAAGHARVRRTMMLDIVFHLKENGTDVRTELLAGLTTFMTMAYILA